MQDKHWVIRLCVTVSIGGSRGGGVPGARPPPLWDPILSFSHTFSPKSAHVGGPCPPPPTGARPPPPPPTGNPGSATG